MRFVMFVGMAVGSTVGWWLGSYEGIFAALLASGVGGVAGIWLAYRLTRDYL
jgi:hypothetical protein